MVLGHPARKEKLFFRLIEKVIPPLPSLLIFARGVPLRLFHHKEAGFLIVQTGGFLI